MIQERKHTEKDVPEVIIQQLPNHQLWRNNSQHKARPSLNNSQHKVRPSLIPNKNISHHKSAAMMTRNFQIHFHHPQRLLRQKIQNLYQRNQIIVKTQVNYAILFARINLLYLLLFSLYRQMQNKRYKQGNSFPDVIFSWCQMCQNFFDYLLSTDIVYCFKYNVILCQLFFQQTGAVKTLPPHNSISVILFFYTFQ